MSMAKHDHTNARDEVEPSSARGIVQTATFAAHEDGRRTLVGLKDRGVASSVLT